MDNPEPWYGVRLIYRLTGTSRQAYEERVIIVRADSGDEAIAKAEELSKDYESDSAEYVGYAMSQLQNPDSLHVLASKLHTP
jgi:hypothetical protein